MGNDTSTLAAGLPNGTFIDSSAITPGAGPVNLTPNWSLATGTYWLVAVANSGSVMDWISFFTPPPGPRFAFGNGTGSAGNWIDAGSQQEPMALISTGTPVSTVPLPAALPLFARGLGALGPLGWRRKKKAIAA
jgi:hypothetical protein